MPDGMNTMDFRDQNGNVIQIPGVDSQILQIKVCNSEGEETKSNTDFRKEKWEV